MCVSLPLAAYHGGPSLSESDSVADKYVVCMTTALFLLLGESVEFQTQREHLVAFVVLIVGTFLYATVLGQMAVYMTVWWGWSCLLGCLAII